MIYIKGTLFASLFYFDLFCVLFCVFIVGTLGSSVRYSQG
jgi:hypothetical protein